MTCPLAAIISSVNLVQNLGGHQGEARRAELRAEASRPVGPRRGGVLGDRDVPPPLAVFCGSAVRSRSGFRAKPRRPSNFVDFGTQEVMLRDSIIQSQLNVKCNEVHYILCK